MTISKEVLRLYVLTDSLGSTSFAAGDNNQALIHRGGILEFTYNGPLVSSKEEGISPNALQLLPNPAHDRVRLQIQAKQAHFPISYQIRDLAGRLIREGQTPDPITEISLKEMPAGLYLGSCRDARSQFIGTQKMVIR